MSMDLEAIKFIVDHSNKINDIAYKLLVATIAIILTTSYVKPVTGKWKMIYFIFLPGWLCLYFSFDGNDKLNRTAIMYNNTYNGIQDLKSEIENKDIKDKQFAIADKELNLNESSEKINFYFNRQLNLFKWGLIIFGVWLFVFLGWWVLVSKDK